MSPVEETKMNMARAFDRVYQSNRQLQRAFAGLAIFILVINAASLRMLQVGQERILAMNKINRELHIAELQKPCAK